MPDSSEISYIVNTVSYPSTSNIYPAQYGMCVIKRITDYRVVVVFYGLNTGIVWIGKIYLPDSPAWEGWVPQATATPPQEYNLPLTGVSDVGNENSRYSKDQFGEVICQISVTPGADIPSYAILATLPEGFRPKKSVSVPAMIAIGGTRDIGQVGINPTGEIGYYGVTVTAGENSRIYASFSFVASTD